MRGSTRRHKVVGAAVAVVAGLVLLAGCGSSDPAHLVGTAPNGGDAIAGDGTTTPTPGGSASPGTTGGTGGATTGTGGGGTGGGGSNAATRPCAIVTEQDANSALGATTRKTSDTDEDCAYEVDDDNAVLLSVQTEPYDAGTVSEIGQLGSMVQKVDGIGDAAYRISVGPETQFHVWIKGKYVVVIVRKGDGDTAGPARTVLDKALTRI
jgi:hypothetical protein